MAMFVSSIMTKGNDKLLSSKDIEVKYVLDIYRQRDGVEKLFRLLKTSMNFDHVGVHSRKLFELFITFVASL